MTEKTVDGQKTTYSYNLDGRLSEIKDNSSQVIAQYQYDPFGQRISKALPQESKIYYYHYGAEGLVAEYNESGSLIQSYGYMPDSFFTSNPIFSHRPDFTEAKGYAFYINDPIGLPQKLITNTGRKIWESGSDAFGKITITNSEFRNPLGFPGQYFDDESGFRYNFKRYYDPELGRYIKSDPIGLFGGINSYGYTYGNPVTNYDPSGEFIPILLGIAVRYAIRQAIRQIPRMMLRRGAQQAMQGPKGSCPSPVGGGRALPPIIPPPSPLPANPPGGQQDPSPFTPPAHGPAGTPGLTPPNAGPAGTPSLVPPNVAGPGAMTRSSSKGRIKSKKLPTKGRIRYVPPKGYQPSNPLPRGPNNGFMDRFGNEWVSGPSRTPGQEFEWDVQLSKTGRAKIGWTTRDGSHANVSLDGKITHK